MIFTLYLQFTLIFLLDAYEAGLRSQVGVVPVENAVIDIGMY